MSYGQPLARERGGAETEFPTNAKGKEVKPMRNDDVITIRRTVTTTVKIEPNPNNVQKDTPKKASRKAPNRKTEIEKSTTMPLIIVVLPAEANQQ